MTDERKISLHTVIMQQRHKISVTGVLDVISFDEEMIVAETDMGVLILKGINLHVSRLSLEKGELDIEGEAASLMYEDTAAYGKPGGSFFGRIFK